MKWPILTVLLLTLSAQPTLCQDDQPSDDSGIRKGIVRIYSTRRSLNLSHPWKRSSVNEVTGSGVWLGDGRVLTNAHVVLYASQIYVQPLDSSDRIAAEVVAQSAEMDLAVIKLEKPGSLQDVKPLPLMPELPKLRSSVQIYGYPTGGETLSVTDGIVSRIEFARYKYSTSGLRIQVDAGLNPGNSGGAAIVDNRIAGIVYSRLRSGDNIGYLIPAEEVQLFLADSADGTYDGKPTLQFQSRTAQNEALRKYHKLKDVTGLIVEKLNRTSDDESAADTANAGKTDPGDAESLRVGDLVTHIGEHDIDNEGMVRLENGLRVSCNYLVQKLTADGHVPVSVFRDGKTVKVRAPSIAKPRFVIDALKGRFPEYFVYGPLVFSEATSEYLTSLEALMAASNSRQRLAAMGSMRVLSMRGSPLILRRASLPKFKGEQLVMVATQLPHRSLQGYSKSHTQIVKSVNGTRIRNMRHLVQTLRDLTDPHVVFVFADRYTERIVFTRQLIDNTQDDILADNGIARRGSAELMKEWNASIAAP